MGKETQIWTWMMKVAFIYDFPVEPEYFCSSVFDAHKLGALEGFFDITFLLNCSFLFPSLALLSWSCWWRLHNKNSMTLGHFFLWQKSYNSLLMIVNAKGEMPHVASLRLNPPKWYTPPILAVSSSSFSSVTWEALLYTTTTKLHNKRKKDVSLILFFQAFSHPKIAAVFWQNYFKLKTILLCGNFYSLSNRQRKEEEERCR